MEKNKTNSNNNVVMHEYEFKATSKQIKKLGFDLGYGATMGVFSAMFIAHLYIGIAKAVKKHMDKKAESKETEETAEE